MKKGIIVAFVAVLALLTVGVAGCGDYFGSEESSVVTSINSNQDVGIWVTGVGKVSVAPDVAVLSLGVQAQAETVAEAQQMANDAMSGIMDALSSHSIAEEDIQTQRYSIQPVKEWRDENYILVGYQVINTVTVKVRDIDDTGSVIDDAVAAGGDYIVINSISFEVDEPEAYYDDIREAAMEDAEDKADQLADLGGVKLGSPIYIAEIDSNTVRTVYYDYDVAEGAVSPGTEINPGETEITMTVQVVYSIS